MKRRQLLLATASLSLAGVSGLSSARTDAANQTDAVQVRDVSLDLGGTTVDIGSARMSYRGGDVVFRGRGWSASSGSRSVTLARADVTVGDVDPETYAALRDGMVRGAAGRSLSPLLGAMVRADVDPKSPISIEAGPVTTDRGPVANEVTATGTVGGVVPDGLVAVARGEPVSKLGAAEFDTASVRRGGVTASAEHVTAEPADGAVSVTADEGTADLPGRTLGLEGIDATFRPPEGGFPEAHRSAFARLRGLAADGSLSLSAVRTTLSESGVTVSNTLDAVGNVRFDATVGKVAEGGVTLVSDFRSRGTLAELLPALRGGGAPDGDGAADDSLDKMVVVEHPNPEGVEGPDDYVDYVFEVTGDLEKLEPNEDRRHARDRVTRRGDRTRVEGSVGTGDDRFAFSGNLQEVDTDGVRITVSDR